MEGLHGDLQSEEKRDSSHPQADAFAGANAGRTNRPAAFGPVELSGMQRTQMTGGQKQKKKDRTAQPEGCATGAAMMRRRVQE